VAACDVRLDDEGDVRFRRRTRRQP
jgi:hypothetical protein